MTKIFVWTIIVSLLIGVGAFYLHGCLREFTATMRSLQNYED
jgi:hypothetical protein